MTYPGRVFHRPKAPSKQAQRIDAQMVVMQRQSSGLDLDGRMAVQIARTHGLSVAEVIALWDAETARRAAR